MRPLRDVDLNRLRVFYADERFDSPVVEEWKRKRKKNFQAKKNKEKAGKLFRYQNETDDVRAGLDDSRKKEWDKRENFNSAAQVSFEQAQKLIAEGVPVVPTCSNSVD